MNIITDIRDVLPIEITFSKVSLPDGGVAYTFWHDQLGKLGRLLLAPFDGETYISCEPEQGADKVKADECLKMLKTVAKTLCEKVTNFLEKEKNLPRTDDLLGCDKISVATRLFTCPTCSNSVAMIIHAPGVTTTHDLEKYAKSMYSKIVETNLPTWVVGQEEIKHVDGWQAVILKAWPERDVEARVISSSELKQLLTNLQKNHCS